MRRAIVGVLAGGALLASGWVGAVVFGPALASAQTSTTEGGTTAPDPVPPIGDEPCRKPFGPGHRPEADLKVAAGVIGVSVDELLGALKGGQTLAQIAQAHNVDPQKVVDALVADAKAKLAAAVTAGKITQAQADEATANLTERITERVNNAFARGPKPGPRHGPKGDGTRHPRPGSDLSVAAAAIGVTRDELLAALRDGQTLAQIAQAHNVDSQKVIDALVADAKAKLAAAVTAGKLTQAQADEATAHLTERMTERVNGSWKPGHPGPRPEKTPVAPATFTA
jgi:predicted DNA-binding protein (UPF0251 family)